MARRKHETESGDYDAVEPSGRRRKLQQQEIIDADDDRYPSASRVCSESQTPRTKGEEFDEQESSPWSDLPDVALEAVAGMMDIGDRIQASRVCKRWRSLIAVARMGPHRRSASYGSPCFLSLSEDNKKCVLTDPLRLERFSIDTPILPEDFVIRYSDQGWLLLTVPIGFVEARETKRDALLFNPLTRTTIRLPELRSFNFDTFGFSSPPTSPECVVFCLYSCVREYCTAVDYCKPGDKGWTRLIIRHEGTRGRTSHWKPLWFKDRIYVLDDCLRVRVYDLFGGQTLNKVISTPWGMGGMSWFTNNFIMNLVEMDDKVMVIFVDLSYGYLRINVLDESQDRWIEVEEDDIGPETLLFCHSSGGMCVKESTSGSGQGGKVYVWDWRCRGKVEKCYCCVSHRTQTFKFAEEDDVLFGIFQKTWIELKP